MEATLKAVPRDSRGKNEARRLRTTGQVPAIVYGGPSQACAVAVAARALLRIMHSESGGNTLIAELAEYAAQHRQHIASGHHTGQLSRF